MNIGALVLYKNRPAVVTDFADGKIEIELEDGKRKIRHKDVSVLTLTPVKNLNEVLNTSCPEADFAEAAEFFENETPVFTEIAELLWQDLPPQSYWAAWKALTASPFFRAEAPDKPIAIRTQKEIAAFVKKQTEKENAGKEKEDFVSAVKKLLNGSVQSIDAEKYSGFFQEIEAFALGKTGKSKFLKELGAKQDEESAHSVLLKTGFWTMFNNPYPSRFNRTLVSPKFVIPPPDLNFDFTDLTEKTAYAIDNEYSTDPDDAICFDGEYLWIHVSNPCDSILPGSDNDLEACGRGATLYLPEGISRMLGEKAVEYFALGLTGVSYALSFKIKLNENAEIQSAEVCRSKIKVKRLNYNEASEKKDSPELKPFFDIAKANLEKRNKAGAVTIDLEKVEVMLRGNSAENTGAEVKETLNFKTVEIKPLVQNEAFLMIKEMMLLAGEAAAFFAFKNNIPFQFISQEINALPKKLPAGYAGEFAKRKHMRARNISTTPAMHCGLGLAMYSQVTSPLRRYGDMICLRQLLNFLDGKELMQSQLLFTKIAAGDIAARNCVSVERASKRHWTLVYLLQNPQSRYEAVITEIQNGCAEVYIPSLGLETKIRLTGSFSLNETVTVKAETVNLPGLEALFLKTSG